MHTEYIISLLLLIFTILFFDPFMVWMPKSFVYILMVVLLVLFSIFALFVWREKTTDEREELHTLIAGKMGYLTGAGVLVIGILYQTLTTHPDPWLVMALSAMVLGKLIGRLYSMRKH